MSTAIAPIEVPNLNQRVNRVTVDYYHRLGELGLVKKRTELIRGVIVNKMSKSPMHCTLIGRLVRLLTAVVPASCMIRRDDPLTLSDSEPEPDIAVVGGSESDFTHRHPSTAELVVEIAVTSLAEDRALAAIYAEAEVKEYWIVVAEKQQVEVYQKPVAGIYQNKRVYGMGETLECSSLPGVKLVPGELFDIK